MLSYSMGLWMWGNDIHEGDARIYAVRDGRHVLYVGLASSGIAYRWFGTHGHLNRNIGGHWYGNSPVGRAIVEALPQSEHWAIDLYTMKECEPYVFRHLTYIPRQCIDRLSVRDAERAMIMELDPELNAI